MEYKTKEIEYSKVWVEHNPLLFSHQFVHFLEQHPSDSWNISLEQTKGNFIIKAIHNQGTI